MSIHGTFAVTIAFDLDETTTMMALLLMAVQITVMTDTAELICKTLCARILLLEYGFGACQCECALA